MPTSDGAPISGALAGNVTMSSPCSDATLLSVDDSTLTSQPTPSNNLPSHTPMLVNSVLSFIKAFRLKSDKDNLKIVVSDRFSCASAVSVKKVLWEFCSNELVAVNLSFHVRRDSDKRSQLSANLEDIIEAFDALDSSESIPSIYCEANDLLYLPPICLDPVAEQVQQNNKTLQSLVSKVENFEKKISSPPSAPISYAKIASSRPAHPVTTTLPIPKSSPFNSPVTDSRACNLVLFGLPETESILQLKSEVDELLEFLSGKHVSVNDVFRLGKYSAGSKCPRPVLIKLTTAWDHKLVLLRKRSLKDFKISRLFHREDVPPDHKLVKRLLFRPLNRLYSHISLPPTAHDVDSAATAPHTTENASDSHDITPRNSRSVSPSASSSSSSYTLNTTELQRAMDECNGPT